MSSTRTTAALKLTNDTPEGPKAPAAPPCPPMLTGEARAHWERTAAALAAAGNLATLDLAALATYCIAWARWTEAEAEVAKCGTVVKSPNGFPIQNPYLSIANKALEQVTKLGKEFGLTPRSRAKVKPAAPTTPTDNWFANLKARQQGAAPTTPDDAAAV